MKKLTEHECKLIEKYKKKVHSEYPGAYLSSAGAYYTILQENELEVKDILSELCFPPQHCPLKAWELATLISKTTQNFNRTHPLRSEGSDIEKKILRIEARRKNGKSEIKRNLKPDGLYIY